MAATLIASVRGTALEPTPAVMERAFSPSVNRPLAIPGSVVACNQERLEPFALDLSVRDMVERVFSPSVNHQPATPGSAVAADNQRPSQVHMLRRIAAANASKTSNGVVGRT